MESDENRTNIIIVIALSVVLLLVAIITIIFHFTNSTKSNVRHSSGNDIVNDNTDNNAVTVYSSYEVGDQVELIDGSSWHVIQKSTVDESMVTVLKDSSIDNNMTKEVAITYLSNSYLNDLIYSLKCSESDISNISLLSKENIEMITGIKDLKLSTVFKSTDYDYLYNNKTLTSMNTDQQLPILICSDDNDNSTLCIGNNNDSYPIRPVIKVNKNYLK